jgi:hypothetical protein
MFDAYEIIYIGSWNRRKKTRNSSHGINRKMYEVEPLGKSIII